MKHRILFCLFLGVILSGCDKSVLEYQQQPLELEVENKDLTTRSMGSEFTLFQNVIQRVDAVGEAYVSGEIYCPSDAEYTFIFTYVFQGNAGTMCEAYLPVGKVLRSTDGGGSFRIETIKLKKGINTFKVNLLFSMEEQQGYVRLLIDKIRGNRLTGEEGIVDLVAQSASKMHNLGGSEEIFWRCSNCGLYNSQAIDYCISCGKK